jgi:hypothetical protein
MLNMVELIGKAARDLVKSNYAIKGGEKCQKLKSNLKRHQIIE